MNVGKKFSGQVVVASIGRGERVKGSVSSIRRVWSGYWLLLISPSNGSASFWVDSKKCRITYA